MEIDWKDYRIAQGSKVQLDQIDPEDKGDFDGDKKDGETLLPELTKELEVLQERFYAGHKQGMLVLLQGMDTCGKDGTIRHVFEGVNPQGVRVASFKVPTAQELDHDYLWRVHQQMPAKGEIVIFNRSHYEDVLVVRVHELVKEDVWKRRYDHINAFERMLTDEGLVILKFFLHISKDEQKQRLLDRLAEPEKHWKYSAGDVKERAHWDAYMQAYEDMLEKTSTEWAPWYVVPANRKWFRNLVVGTTLVKTLRKLDPGPTVTLDQAFIDEQRAALGAS